MTTVNGRWLLVHFLICKPYNDIFSQNWKNYLKDSAGGAELRVLQSGGPGGQQGTGKGVGGAGALTQGRSRAHSRDTQLHLFCCLPLAISRPQQCSCALNINTQNMPHVSVGLFWHFICDDKHCSKAGPVTSSRDGAHRGCRQHQVPNGRVSKKPKGALWVGWGS